jgi:hypothetical protein
MNTCISTQNFAVIMSILFPVLLLIWFMYSKVKLNHCSFKNAILPCIGALVLVYAIAVIVGSPFLLLINAVSAFNK